MKGGNLESINCLANPFFQEVILVLVQLEAVWCPPVHYYNYPGTSYIYMVLAFLSYASMVKLGFLTVTFQDCICIATRVGIYGEI